MAVTPVLQADGLRFRFDRRTLFDGLSLSLANGITWLRGPNGQGKTTLLQLLGGAVAPHAGSIRLGELDCARDAVAYRLHCFLCSGDSPALPWFTVRELLELHLALYPAALAGDLAAELDAFGIGDTLDQPLATLSLGQHKKVLLALALALPVRVLLLDEPFNGLDANAVDYLRARLGERAPHTCIVLTSHVEPQLRLAGTLDL
jgi:ABC-2 type transport system ATP-binding protein